MGKRECRAAGAAPAGAGAIDHQKLWQQIQALHAKWLPILGLEDWTDQSYIADTPDGKTYAEVVRMLWEYKRFAVCYYPDLALYNPDFLEGIVVHELVHVLRDPERRLLHDLIDRIDDDEDEVGGLMREFYYLHDERLTTELAHALLRARNQAGVAFRITHADDGRKES